MEAASELIRRARRDAGMTQSDLAREMKTTQTAIARLERRGSNPTVSTVARAVRATGSELNLTAAPVVPQVDETQIAAHLRMTPAKRVRYHRAGYRNMAEFVTAARRAQLMAWADFNPDEILARLTARGVDFVVVGGFAAVIHGSPRVTQDLDVCYSQDPENLRALSDVLTELNARLDGTQDELPIPADERQLKGCRFIALQTDLGKLDLLSTPRDPLEYPDLKTSADRVDVGDFLVSVAALPDLIATKRLAALKHRADITELEAIERLRGL